MCVCLYIYVYIYVYIHIIYNSTRSWKYSGTNLKYMYIIYRYLYTEYSNEMRNLRNLNEERFHVYTGKF